MKKYGILAAVLAFALGSCDKIDELTKFNMDYNADITISAAADLNLPFSVASPDIPTNSESIFAANDTRKDKIEEIKLTKLDFELKSPEKSDFGFLKSVEVFISADGTEEMRVAWSDNIPDDAGTFIQLQTSSEDLKPYIKPDNFSLRVSTVTDEVITTDHDIEIQSSFFVDARVLGQ